MSDELSKTDISTGTRHTPSGAPPVELTGVVAAESPEFTDENFHQSFLAPDWARAFVKRAKADPNFATDEGNMIGWFANAIMRGYDEHARKADERTTWIQSHLFRAEMMGEDETPWSITYCDEDMVAHEGIEGETFEIAIENARAHHAPIRERITAREAAELTTQEGTYKGLTKKTFHVAHSLLRRPLTVPILVSSPLCPVLRLRD